MGEMDALLVSEGSKAKARKAFATRHKVSWTFAKNLTSGSHKAKVEEFVSVFPQGMSGLRQPGSHLGFCHFASQSLGKHIPSPGKQIGKPDRLRAVWQETALWSQMEEANLHILSATDVYNDFMDRLEEGIAVRQAEKKAGTLGETGEAELKAMLQKQDSMTNNKKAREKYNWQPCLSGAV